MSGGSPTSLAGHRRALRPVTAHRPAGIFAPRKASGLCTALLSVLLLLLFAAALPLKTSVKIGADEDFELAKPVLAWSGYSMYTQVWDDQPPLYTFLIVQALKRFSFSVLWPRLITEVFTLVLVVCVFALLRRGRGPWLGFVGALLVVASPGFVELSSSRKVRRKRSTRQP